MKSIFKCFITICSVCILLSCEKNNEFDNRFIGTWKISTPDNDTIIFIDGSVFKRKYFDNITHSFKYGYDKDSITIQYSGPSMILVKPTTHYYEFKSNLLKIDLRNGCYGFDTEIYSLSRVE
jgi:hypothetical protein